MRWLGIDVYLEREPSGSVEGECPSCRAMQRFTKHALTPRWLGRILLFPSSELLVCCRCGEASRDESALDRVMSALFLLPFLGVILGGTGTGLWLLWQLVTLRQFEAGYAAISLALLGAGAFAGARAVRTLRRLLTPRRKLPLAGWGTRL